jgi:superfamily I DNA/RNA helicase
MTPAPGKLQNLNLLRRTVVQSEFKPTANQSVVIDSILNSTDARLLVYGPAGSGKSATLIESVTRKIASGFDSNSILVLAYGRERASELRDEIVIQSGASAFEPLVRTFHSLAFSIINTQLELDSPKYVLISGAEQDSFIRDLLVHPENSPGVNWPPELIPALGTRGFARELRDLILRASERNFSHEKLIQKAQLLNEPWWIPAAKFWKSYDDILGLRYGIVPGTPLRIDPSSIISLAITKLRSDEKLLTLWQSRFKLIMVDEFQESDKAQRELLELLAGPQVCIFADPNSTVGQFRGAEPEGIGTFAQNNNYKKVYLDQAFRGTPSINNLVAAITEKLPNRTGIGEIKEIEFVGKDRGVDVAKLANQVDCANYIAHAFRTAHLRDGLAWSQMAVILRSPGAAVAALTRAFALNNIPIEIDTDALSLGENPAITPILTIAEIALGRIALTPANWEGIEALLLSEFGGADALSLRQMRIDIAKVRGADEATRSSTEIILSILNENEAPIPWEQIKSLKQIADLITAARAEIKRGGDISDLIWAIWSSAKSFDGSSMANSW